MNYRTASPGWFDPSMLVTHRFSLADIKQGYEVFGSCAEEVLKVLITP
jgi:threonine dehydrogenase-like Zn-dependent dehydrogenase